MEKKDIKNIINQYLEHVRRYSWQPGTTEKQKLTRFLKSNIVSNLIKNNCANCYYLNRLSNICLNCDAINGNFTKWEKNEPKPANNCGYPISENLKF